MKSLKFSPPLPELILNGEKDTTWRVDDEKSLRPNEVITLIRKPEYKEFGKARILWVKETLFSNLTQEDVDGHEKFSSEKEMLETYSTYYSKEITKDTPVKIVKFKLLT